MSHQDSKVRQKWDTEFSTYFWNIHLDPRHPSTRTPMLTGYSKVRNQSEAQDKDYLLQKKIAMIYQQGYFDRMKYVEFFTMPTAGAIIVKQQAVRILICFPDNYNIPEANHDVIFKKHGQWLKSAYQRIRFRKPLEELTPAQKKGVDKDSFLEVGLRYHPTQQHLLEYALSLMKHGHPDGAVNAYMAKYKTLREWE